MTLYAYLFFALAILVWFIGWCLYFHRRGYRRGEQAGYEKGLLHGFDSGIEWFVKADQDVSIQRVAMWREGIKKR